MSVKLGGDAARERFTVRATAGDGSVKTFKVVSRIDTSEELSYYGHVGIPPYVLRQLVTV